MKKTILILAFLLPFLGISQWDMLLLASQQQADTGPTNLYTFANAANPDAEVNSTTGTTAGVGSGTWSSVTTSPTPQNGTHSLKWTLTDPGKIATLATLTSMPTAATLTIKMYVYVPSGQSSCQVYLLDADGWTAESAVTISTFDAWHEITLVGTTDASTVIIKPYVSSGGATGQWMAFDNIRITQ